MDADEHRSGQRLISRRARRVLREGQYGFSYAEKTKDKGFLSLAELTEHAEKGLFGQLR